ncbi:hypothetical protein OUZ56_011707 [Daphnia magna]|uniref:Uncharacterized protein n=1 Tax=Daphnia magna TaxID=35525 RepID=A0ABQ9Z0Y4_9CRUS|nr:hypothetical protein OUZ56_011707 [Daphnia magna]
MTYGEQWYALEAKIWHILGVSAINLYFVYNINISLKSVFEIHGANLPHYHCQLTPLVGHLNPTNTTLAMVTCLFAGFEP